MDWVQWCWVNRHGMDRGWVNGNCVNGCRVDRFGMNGGWLVSRWGMSNTIIFHISYVTTIATDVSCIVDNLDAAVRKGHLVLASHDVGVRRLFLVKAGARIVIVDAIFKGIRLGWLSIAMHRSWLGNNGQGVNWSWWWRIGSRMNWQDGPSSVGRCHSRNKHSSFGKHCCLWLLLHCWMGVN